MNTALGFLLLLPLTDLIIITYVTAKLHRIQSICVAKLKEILNMKMLFARVSYIIEAWGEDSCSERVSHQ